jgi:hypothetical protein
MKTLLTIFCLTIAVLLGSVGNAFLQDSGLRCIPNLKEGYEMAKRRNFTDQFTNAECFRLKQSGASGASHLDYNRAGPGA